MSVPFFLDLSNRTSIAMGRRLLNAGRKVRDACAVGVSVTWMMRRWDLVFRSVTRVERGEGVLGGGVGGGSSGRVERCWKTQ